MPLTIEEKRERKLAYNRQYMTTDRAKELERIRKRRWREAHPDHDKLYYQKTREDRRKRAAKYYLENAEDIKKKSLEYYFNTKDKSRAKRTATATKWQKRFRQTPTGKALTLARSLLMRSLGKINIDKTGRTHELLGYTSKELRTYIESKFRDTMSWNNFGKVWQLDHKKEVALFLREGCTDPKIINALDNLQPLLILEHKQKTKEFFSRLSQERRGDLS